MSFLYPRIVAVTRPNQDTSVGAQPYSGVLQTNEAIVATGIMAHIQSDRQGTKPQTGLPADAAGESIWKIIFKAARGLVQTNDIITDDLGNRYQVISADWGPLVTTCHSQILQN
jgi:hypothetical protein